MREIGRLQTEAEARRFGDYLYAQGIKNQVEACDDGPWAIWVHAEDRIEPARRLLEEFRRNPADARYTAASGDAEAMRRAAAQTKREAQARTYDSRKLWPESYRQAIGPLTLALMIISVAVGISSRLGSDPRLLQTLFISSFVAKGDAAWWQGLIEVADGQFWRLLTPIFIHFGPLHLLFNMMWLRDLGTIIERRTGTHVLASLVLVIAVCSNLAQYAVSGPAFGGMSGVVYGLLGYLWIRGKFDPGSVPRLHPTTISMMIVWFFLCLSGLVGNVANTIHAVGLGIGMAWGYLSSGHLRRTTRLR